MVITYGILNQFNKGIVAPPWIITVAITINEVVVSIACRASDTVLRMANANDIAPLKPTIRIRSIKFTFSYQN